MKKIRRFICVVLGHRGGFNDSGYNVCDRCGLHEYYDLHDYARYQYLWVRRFGFKDWWRYSGYHKCCDCKKSDMILGFKDCIPF
jgi:hypothetical protein